MTTSDMTHDEMLDKLRQLNSNLAAVTQERDGLRDQLKSEIRAKESLGRILDEARLEAIVTKNKYEAILADEAITSADEGGIDE